MLDALIAEAGIDADARAQMTRDAVGLIESLRREGGYGLMEVFLEEYGLSTDEGVALGPAAGIGGARWPSDSTDRLVLAGRLLPARKTCLHRHDSGRRQRLATRGLIRGRGVKRG